MRKFISQKKLSAIRHETDVFRSKRKRKGLSPFVGQELTIVCSCGGEKCVGVIEIKSTQK